MPLQVFRAKETFHSPHGLKGRKSAAADRATLGTRTLGRRVYRLKELETTLAVVAPARFWHVPIEWHRPLTPENIWAAETSATSADF